MPSVVSENPAAQASTVQTLWLFFVIKWPTVVLALIALLCVLVGIFTCFKSIRRYKVLSEYTGLTDSYMQKRKQMKNA